MPLDTQITIGIEAEGTRDDQGRYVPGPETSYPVWADERNAGSTDEETPAGVVVREIRTFMCRYFQELQIAPVSRISVTKLEDDGSTTSTWNLLNKAESSERRRFITLECVRTS